VRLRLTEVVLEGKVQRLGREVPDDVGGVSSPERDETLIGVGPGETVRDTLVRGSETTLLDPGKKSARKEVQVRKRSKAKGRSSRRGRATHISSWF
jgi:hypothetical protein